MGMEARPSDATMATLLPPGALPPYDAAPEPAHGRGRVVRGPDRRQGSRDRRRGPRDRRRGRPDRREHRVERRIGPVDRRSGRPNRRLGGQRRRDRAPRRPGGLDPMVVLWIANVLCWIAVVAVLLIWGR